MNSVDYASAHTDQADLVILSHVETIRDQEQPATPSAVASLIGGAPLKEISRRLERLWQMGVVEPARLQAFDTYQLTEMGSELLRRDLPGWSPSLREDERRAAWLLNGANYRI
jgi:hypothetical protein